MAKLKHGATLTSDSLNGCAGTAFSLNEDQGQVVRSRPVDSGEALVKSQGRSPETVAFEREMVSFFVDAADMFGVPKSVAAIYGICFASANPLSFADISLRLDISQGSISQGLRVLRDMGTIRVVGTHERRDYFAPEVQLRKLATRFIDERLEAQLNISRERLRVMKGSLPSANDAAAAELGARLKYLDSWQEKTRALLPLIKTVLKLG